MDAVGDEAVAAWARGSRLAERGKEANIEEFADFIHAIVFPEMR